MYLKVSIENFMNSQIGIALISTLLIPVVVFVIGLIIQGITMGFAEIFVEFIGPGLVYFLLNDVSFVGTVHHELSHALVAFITGAKITEIELYNPKEHVLGHVSYYTRGNIFFQSLQCTLSSAAPVYCGIITLTILIKYAYPMITVDWQKWILIYLTISIFIHMSMSTQDVNVAMRGLPICLIIIFIVSYFIKFNIFVFLEEAKNLGYNFYKTYL